MEEPIPIIFIMGFSFLILVFIYFFKSKEDLDCLQKTDNNHIIAGAPDLDTIGEEVLIE